MSARRSRTAKEMPAARLEFVEPMKCQLRQRLPAGSEWVYEIKFDGFRGLALIDRSGVRLLSRNNKDLGGKFSDVLQALRQLKCASAILDGEVVALDEKGRSSFQLLQRVGDPGPAPPDIFYYVYDLLHLDGRDLTRLPLVERKSILKKLLAGAPDCIRFSDVLAGEAEQICASMQQLGLEGLIAKKRDSAYETGKRSGAWVKFKWAQEQEFVIGGYTDPEGSRPYFGSILAGYYDGPKLIFAAKVGTGFDTERLRTLHAAFEKIRVAETPFANLPERGGVITRAQMRFCKWVAPRMVCQVRFTEWTSDGHLRQPVYLGLREDKDAREVVREMAGAGGGA
jgi:bifunctional non-homologous end joining protein LigD